MRAVQFKQYGGPDVLELVEIPAPQPKPGEALIRVRAAAVNPADFKWRQGMFAELIPLALPHILGYDIAGTIGALGAAETGVEVGRRVLGMLSPVKKGAYAEYAVIPTAELVALPDGLDFATGAALPTAGLTGFQLIEEHIGPRAGERILITGALGAVGRFALHAALALGAHVVAGVRGSQVAEALALGAREAIVLGEDDAEAVFDHVADTVGGDDVAALCRRLSPGGRIRTVATTPIDATALDAEPVFISVHPDSGMLARIAAIVAEGRVAVPIARRLPLAEAREGHRLVEAGGAGGKVVLEM